MSFMYLPRDVAMLGILGGGGGDGSPGLMRKSKNIIYIKLSFEFSCSIFVQYSHAFTKNTLSLFKFSFNLG